MSEQRDYEAALRAIRAEIDDAVERTPKVLRFFVKAWAKQEHADLDELEERVRQLRARQLDVTDALAEGLMGENPPLNKYAPSEGPDDAA